MMTIANHMRKDTGSSERDIAVSRRCAIGASALAVAGLLQGAALGRSEGNRAGGESRAREREQRMGQMRERFERMRNAGDDERVKIMAEFSAQRRAEAVDRYQERLEFSDAEWKVIRPRLEAVYDCVHSRGRSGVGATQDEVEVQRRQLQQVLREEGAEPAQIKAVLTALRGAQEKATRELVTARQSLRQLLTLRQEAELVLAGLLV